MIVEIGHFALVLSLFVALVLAVVPMIGAARGEAGLMAVGTSASLTLFALLLLSFASLTYAYAVSDFSVDNVARNSNSMMPMFYKISAVWGNHEGSMLLWVLTLALFSCAVALFGGNLPPSLRARTLAVQGILAVAFLLFILGTSNPFERLLPAPLDGRDLNPLLQDPVLAIHPPLLYIGYVGFSIVFSFAVAALIEGRVDPSWARWVRPWTLAAWVFLTAGIAMGSWWAYYELGWGGWWYWDPVENASFMPWLIGTALLHSAIVVERRDALKSWTVLLAILAFGLSLMGTFLVRSGILTSVHAFAVDPERGVFILVLLALAIGLSLLLYAWRAPSLKATGLFTPVSREGSLLLNNFLLSLATVTVLLGTLSPLFIEAYDESLKITVGPPYFNMTFVPIMVPLVIATAIGPMLAWKRGNIASVLPLLAAGFLIAVLVGLGVGMFGPGHAAEEDGWLLFGGAFRLGLGTLGMSLAAWLAVGVVVDWGARLRLHRSPLGDAWKRARLMPRGTYGMSIAHFGLAIAIVGMTGSSLWKDETVTVLFPGDTLEMGDYRLVFEGVKKVPGPNYTADRGSFRVFEEGTLLEVLKPEKRVYPAQGMPTTESAIRGSVWGDLYVTLGDAHEDGGWTVRVFTFPLVGWIWMGSLLLVIGGLVSLSDRRLRVGAPAGRRDGEAKEAKEAKAPETAPSAAAPKAQEEA